MNSASYLLYQLKCGYQAILGQSKALPEPWVYFGWIVHPHRGYEPALWDSKGHFVEGGDYHAFDLSVHLGDAQINNPTPSIYLP